MIPSGYVYVGGPANMSKFLQVGIHQVTTQLASREVGRGSVEVSDADDQGIRTADQITKP